MIKKIKSLEFYIGGYMGSSCKIVITGNDVKYYHSESSFITDEIGIIINPSESDIDELINVMNTIKISEWKDEYVNTSIMDGTQWNLDIEYNNKKKSIYGSNCYPGEESNCSEIFEDYISIEDLEDETLTDFDILLKAFDKLINKEIFYWEEEE